MKFLSRLFGSRREMNLTTALERQRLGRTMPGQTGAVARARLGFSSKRFASANSSAILQDARLQTGPPPGNSSSSGGFLLCSPSMADLRPMSQIYPSYAARPIDNAGVSDDAVLIATFCSRHLSVGWGSTLNAVKLPLKRSLRLLPRAGFHHDRLRYGARSAAVGQPHARLRRLQMAAGEHRRTPGEGFERRRVRRQHVAR